MKIKRFLGSDGEEEESMYVEIKRRDRERLGVLESIYADDVGVYIDELPKEIIDGIKNHDKRMGDSHMFFDMSDKIRIGMKVHGLRVSPRVEILISEDDIPEGNNLRRNGIQPGWISVYVFDEYWNAGNINVEKLLAKYPKLDPENSVAHATVLLYKEIKENSEDFFEKCKKSIFYRRRRPSNPRITYRHMEMSEFMKRDYWRGRICVTNIPTLGWAKFIKKISLEKDYNIPSSSVGVIGGPFKKRIFKRGNNYQVRLFSPTRATGDEKVFELMFYYIDKLGIDSKFHNRKTAESYQKKQRFKIAQAMHIVYGHIDKNGQDSDEDISKWMQTARKW